jgi:hypothetical protein
MRSSRSIPPSRLTPELAYTDDADAHYERARAAGARGGTLASEADAS